MSDSHQSDDRIFLHGLSTECIIGFIDWERRVKQTVILDIELPVDCRRAAIRDEVSDTLDYSRSSPSTGCASPSTSPAPSATRVTSAW